MANIVSATVYNYTYSNIQMVEVLYDDGGDRFVPNDSFNMDWLQYQAWAPSNSSSITTININM